jgi:hypothetical protein
MEEPKSDIQELAAATLDNATINPNSRLHEAQLWAVDGLAALNAPAGPALIEANDDKFVRIIA